MAAVPEQPKLPVKRSRRESRNDGGSALSTYGLLLPMLVVLSLFFLAPLYYIFLFSVALRRFSPTDALAMLNGELPAVKLRDEIAANTRALVKKQRTWFRTQLPPHRIVDAFALTDVDALFPVAEGTPRDA